MNWPEEVKQQIGGREPRIGDWYTFCCEHDLVKITTQVELDELFARIEDHMDDGIAFGRFFETEEAALEYLKEPP
jgi:hypothetical protein